MFDEKCIRCKTEMEDIHECCPRGQTYPDMIYWCPERGTLVKFYDSPKGGYNSEPQDEDWKIPNSTV